MVKVLLTAILLFSIAPKTLGQIEGIVIDKKKNAVTAVIIIVSDTSHRVIDTVKSDSRGGYAFKGLKPGKYNVEAKAAGFLPAIYKNIVVTTPPKGTDEGDDTYYAIRLDIKLIPVKPQQ